MLRIKKYSLVIIDCFMEILKFLKKRNTPYISLFFFTAVTEFWQKQLRNGRIHFGSLFADAVHHGMGVIEAGTGTAAHTAAGVKKQR